MLNTLFIFNRVRVLLRKPTSGGVGTSEDKAARIGVKNIQLKNDASVSFFHIFKNKINTRRIPLPVANGRTQEISFFVHLVFHLFCAPPPPPQGMICGP
jgi:hypothetical protein